MDLDNPLHREVLWYERVIEREYLETGDETIPYELALELIEFYKLPPPDWPEWLTSWCIDRATEENPAPLSKQLEKKNRLQDALWRERGNRVSWNRESPDDFEGKRSLRSLARELGISHTQLDRWRKQWFVMGFKMCQRRSSQG